MVGLVLFVGGFRVNGGAARGVVAISLLSILIAAPVLTLAVLILMATVQQGATIGWVIGIMNVVIGIAFLTPAVLALSSRADYRAWRRGQAVPLEDARPWERRRSRRDDPEER
jgi:hypothetical protein